MKRFLAITLLVALVQAVAPAAYTSFETFDSGGAGWAVTGNPGSSTFTLTTDGVGKHIRTKLVRDVNDFTGRYAKALGTTLNLSAVGASLYVEADVQVVGGFNNYSSMYIGLGNSDCNTVKNQATTRVYWDGSSGQDQYAMYGCIYDSAGAQLMVQGANKVGQCGTPYRIKSQFTVVAGPLLSYDVKAYTINADGSTGSLVGEAAATQLVGLGTPSLSVNQVGIFIQNSALASTTISGTVYNRYIECNVDNIYVSDTGFNSSPVKPSWYNFTASDTDISETFSANPAGTWLATAPAASGCSFTWKSQSGDGYMDVVLTRRANSSDPCMAARFTRGLGKQFVVENDWLTTEKWGIYWFTEFDAYIVTSDSFAEGLVGTGNTAVAGEYTGGPYGDEDFAAGGIYGAQELGDGIRATMVGYGHIYAIPPVRRAQTISGGLEPGNTYRFKLAIAQKYDTGGTTGKRTRMIGSVYSVNADGTDGPLISSAALWQGTYNDSLYADVMGIFSTLQTTTTTRTLHMYVDNMHFSTVGFRLTAPKPTWLAVPLCGELTSPMPGDANGDCVVNILDVKAIADNWLRLGN